MPEALAPETPAAPAGPVVVPEIPVFTEKSSVPAPTGEQNKPGESETPAQPEAKPDTETPEKPEKPGKSRFERRIDRVTRERAQERARADAAEREVHGLRQRYETPQRAGAVPLPRVEDFTDVQEYAKAYAEASYQNKVSENQQTQQSQTAKQSQQQLDEKWAAKLDKADRKYDDFDEVVGELKINSAWSAAIALADNGEDVAYHLGTHIEEAKRIIALHPLLQAVEIGKLAATLAAKPPPPKKPSAAPAPIAPVSGVAQSVATEIKDGMDYKDFVKVRNKQLGRSP